MSASWFDARESSEGEGNQERIEAAALAAPEILDACCGGRMWWWDKAHPLAVYMDKREAASGSIPQRPNWNCAPDVLADFRAMPFASSTFRLVVFDPPHNVRKEPGGINGMRYGALTPESEQDDLRRGFAECWRVLAPGGTLVFKWAGPLARVEPHFPAAPIVGTRTPRGGQTRWLIFYKPLAEAGGDLLREALTRAVYVSQRLLQAVVFDGEIGPEGQSEADYRVERIREEIETWRVLADASSHSNPDPEEAT